MNNLRYSIVYAVIRPEIIERISVGLITIDNNNIHYRYSDAKLKALEHLYSNEEYKFVSKVIRSMNKNQKLQTIDTINYLTRYSNNFISISEIKSIDLEANDKNKEWLFQNYVYSKINPT